MQAGDVKRVLHNFSIEVDASEKGDLEEEKVVKRLRSVSLNPLITNSYMLMIRFLSGGRRFL